MLCDDAECVDSIVDPQGSNQFGKLGARALRFVLFIFDQDRIVNTYWYLIKYWQDDAIAIVDNGVSYTFAHLKQAADQLAFELVSAESSHTQSPVQPNDRICILANNSFYWAAAYLATLKVGAVGVLLPTAISADELDHTIAFVGSSCVITEQCYLPLLGDHDDLKVIVEPEFDLQKTYANEQIAPVSIANADSEALLMLTSGTTAQPKIVRVSHRNIQANTSSIVEMLEIGTQDCMMLVIPMYYCFGLSVLQTHMRAGARLVLSNRFAFPETVLDLAEETECTSFAGVPSMYHTLVRNTTLSDRTLPQLTKFQQAGGKLPPVLIRELAAAMPNADIHIMYGQTEATARLAHLPAAQVMTKLGSVGKAIPGVVLRVVNESGAEVAPGEVGEIVAEGDNVTLGYWRVGAYSKFRNGKLYTGDLGRFDEDGFLYIVDRISDMIKSYGMRVSSQKVEALLMEIPQIVNASVIGVPDLARGEAIFAYILTNGDRSLTEKDVVQHCRERMPRHMIPSQINFVESLPLSKHGKVQKAVLRQYALLSSVAREFLGTVVSD